jgi:isopenicillin N synthase-like dioxygenase
LEEYAYQPRTAALVESFDTVRDLRPSDVPEGASGVGPVDWPAECPGLKTALGAFYAAADDVARDLFVAFARAARLDANADGSFAADASALADRFLADFGPASQCSMRAMRYPGTDDPDARAIAGGLIDQDASGDDVDEPSRSYPSRRAKKRRRRGLAGSDVTAVGIAEHTDFECFTLLHQSAPGLELRDLAGAWRTARCDPDRSRFTVIVADMLERWTRGFFVATPHRVALTRGERFSLVRFNGLDPGAVVAPLARWFPGSSPANKNYAPVAQGKHTAALVTRAAKNLERARTLARALGVGVGALSENPRRFAQLLVLDQSRTRVLLGKHRAGEFEGMYTGFIAEVVGHETPRDAAVDALGRGGLRLGREDGFCSGWDDVRRVPAERGRFRFAGWLDAPVVEHEFTLRLGDGVTLEEETIPVPRGNDDRDVDEGTRVDVVPRWFATNEIPYDEMPADDRAWYPTVLGLAKEEEEETDRVGVRWRRIAVGHFVFDDRGGLREHSVDTVATDAYW